MDPNNTKLKLTFLRNQFALQYIDPYNYLDNLTIINMFLRNGDNGTDMIIEYSHYQLGETIDNACVIKRDKSRIIHMMSILG